MKEIGFKLSNKFQEALKFITLFTSKLVNRPVLMKIAVFMREGKIYLQATDSFTGIRIMVFDTKTTDNHKGFCFDKNFFINVIRIFKKDVSAYFIVDFEKSIVGIKSNDKTSESYMISGYEGQFPNMDKYFMESDTKFTKLEIPKGKRWFSNLHLNYDDTRNYITVDIDKDEMILREDMFLPILPFFRYKLDVEIYHQNSIVKPLLFKFIQSDWEYQVIILPVRIK